MRSTRYARRSKFRPGAWLAAIISDRGLDDVGSDPAHIRLAAAIEAGDTTAAEQAAHDLLDPTAAALRSLIGG